jgi:hypothetical protein
VLAIAGVVGLAGRLAGRLTLVNPTVLFRETLQEPEWEFRKNAIFYAGKHFEKNAAIIDRKANAAVATSVLMLVALVIAATWLAH